MTVITDQGLKRTELLLFGIGVLCALSILAAMVYGFTAQHASAAFGTPVAAQQTAAGASAPKISHTGEAEVIGRLQIPQLALSVPILSDFQTTSLIKGVGHVPGTAMPGGLGTLGLAGHRDTYFRPLRNIRKNMDIQVSNADGIYHYLVDSTEIVQPEAVEVLDIRTRPELTLITCYPFYYVGAAPKRFIVHAHLVSALPDPPHAASQ